METNLTTRASFAAGTKHHDGEERHHHGHTYAVEATTTQIDWALASDVRRLAGELNERDLEDMMPGASVSLDGIAVWFMERLLMAHPGVITVKVTQDGRMGDLSVTAIRTLRAAVR